MSLDSNVMEMQEKALKIAKYYMKGFGNTFFEIVNWSYHYKIRPERKECVEEAYACLKEVESFYEKIPFEELQNEREFCPLFCVRQMLPRFREKMEKRFQECNDTTYKDFGDEAVAIIRVASAYDNTLRKLLKKNQKIP